jgi:hypothetical protein
MGMVDPQQEAPEEAPHPLLDQLIVDNEEERVFASTYRTDSHWILDQHRLKDGQALIPAPVIWSWRARR